MEPIDNSERDEAATRLIAEAAQQIRFQMQWERLMATCQQMIATEPEREAEWERIRRFWIRKGGGTLAAGFTDTPESETEGEQNCQ